MTNLNPGRSRTLTASFFAADGKPARVDGDPVWGVSDPAVAELVDTSSAFSKKVRAVGPGTCEVYCTADADLGEGVRPLTLNAVFVVPEPEAQGGTLNVSEEEVPPAPEPDPIIEPAPEPTPEPVVVDAAPEPVAEPVPETPAPAAEEAPVDPPGDPAPPIDDRPTE